MRVGLVFNKKDNSKKTKKKMEKKEYLAPEMEVVKMQIQSALLINSGDPQPDFGEGDGPGE